MQNTAGADEKVPYWTYVKGSHNFTRLLQYAALLYVAQFRSLFRSIPFLVLLFTSKLRTLAFKFNSAICAWVLYGPPTSANPAQTRKHKHDPGQNPKSDLKSKKCPKIK